MKYKQYCLSIILVLFTVSLFAAGKKEQGTYTKVEGLKTWTYTDDISALPDGKYNIIVKGVDTAGNTAAAGPYNIFISVESDLATVHIANPTEGMIVSGNLNIVGDAFDDDGVASVALKLDDGYYQTGEGTAFWNYYLDLKDLSEGPHTITVRATDINGLPGIEKQVHFTVDKSPPESEIVSHKAGSILSGTVTLRGIVHDTGGIKAFFVSRNGTDYTKLRTSFNKKKSAYEFAQKINTKKLKDGAYTLWYKSIDVSGTEGESSFLFFVDNNPPDITIIQPADGAEVNGIVQLAGKITDTIGTKNLTITLGSDTSQVKLIPGDPYWTQAVDLTSYGANISVELIAEDLAGNKTIKKIRLKNSTASDEPVLSLYIPEKTGILQETVQLGISITDDDGVKGYEYSLDKGDAQFAECTGTSVLSLTNLTQGTHHVKVTPYDIHDTPGKTVSRTFTVPKASAKNPEKMAPVITFNGPVSGFIVKDSLKVTGNVSSEAGLKSFSYFTADDPEKKQTPVYADSGSGTFTVSIPAGPFKEGNTVLDFDAVDTAGNSSTSFIVFTKDTLPPELKLFTPVKGDTVNGKVTVSGSVTDLSPRFTCAFSTDGKEYKPVEDPSFFAFNFDYSAFKKKPGKLFFRTADSEGNQKEFTFPFNVNSTVDIPVVTVQYPRESAVLRGDAVISGTALDDDGIKTIYYSFDGKPFQKIDGAAAFTVPVPLSELADTEHTVTVKAEDLNGVFSKPVVRRFNVSRKGPDIKVDSPASDTYIKGSTQIKGTASDSNGIKSVFVSLDNGATYSRVQGDKTWVYTIDTTLLKDGTHSLYVKAADKTSTVSYYTTILNIDNMPPEIKLDSPVNGGEAENKLVFNGKADDNTELQSIKLEVMPLTPQKDASSAPVSLDLGSNSFIHKVVDTSALQPGWYTFRLKAEDKAGNITYKTGSVEIPSRGGERNQIHLLYPREGDRFNAFFKVEGIVDSGEQQPGSVVVILDGAVIGTADVMDSGRFVFSADSTMVSDGKHTLLVKSSEVDTKVHSGKRNFIFHKEGPWILFKRSSGDFLTRRTYIRGNFGYAAGKDKKTPKVKSLGISYDNGRTFIPVKPTSPWKARIETETYPDGSLPVLAEVMYEDSSRAYTKMVLTIDKTPPVVTLDTPKEGESFNSTLLLQGSADDNGQVKDISFLLREGDKNSYEVPSFIQGLYLDLHALGATYGEIGAGLTFFNDNVKLQLEAGLAPPGRFSGIVLGGKLLANIATIPYSFIFGPDWQNFSMAAALGATFSYFTMSEDGFTFDGTGVVLGSIIGQIELIKYTIPDLSMFNTYSLYAEGSLWFISSDVQAGVVPRYSIGTRIGIF